MAIFRLYPENSPYSIAPYVLLLLTCAWTSARADAGRAGSAPSTRKSISAWVSCSGKSDDTSGVAKAFEAARHGAFTLVVDCPVNIKVGMDISRSVFIDDGTTVEFSGSGKFTVDNQFIPAFVIADARNITLTDWNVEYDAALPIDQNVGGYWDHDAFVAGAKPGNAFSDQRLTRWLAANRSIVFDKTNGNVNSHWPGTSNVCAVFFFTGDSSEVRITGMHLYVPQTAGGERFIPVAFSLNANFKANQTVLGKMPVTGQTDGVPNHLTFSNITLDGTYMGWVGGLQDTLFENIHSQRYGDLQDAGGGTIGGVKKWFAPPHLFYFNYPANGDPALFNTNIEIRDVVDEGPRVGKARDLGGTDSISGYALSLKLGCVTCSVTNYRSSRPDGFMDVLTSDGLKVSNVTASFDSGFLNNLFPGWRFPSPSYKNVIFDNITLIDTAENSVAGPISNANQPTNQGIVMKNVHVEMNHWTGNGKLPLPTITGQATDISMDYSIKGNASRIVRARHEPVEITFQAAPAPLPAGTATVLNWSVRDATHCEASGAWSGPVPTSGSRSVRISSNQDFILTCDNGAVQSDATLHVTVAP
jgi:hypothetical protein